MRALFAAVVMLLAVSCGKVGPPLRHPPAPPAEEATTPQPTSADPADENPTTPASDTEVQQP